VPGRNSLATGGVIPELPGRRGRNSSRDPNPGVRVTKFLLWCLLLFLCWPLALLALVLYPLVWLLLIPFRLVGFAVEGVLGLVRGVILLPARIPQGPRRL
jgi:hypothetical protein